jgi:hypothetical protein
LLENDLYISFTINCFIKKQIQQSALHLQCTKHQLSLDGAGFRGLDVNSLNSRSHYFVHLCIHASEPTLHQKRTSIADWSHLRWQTAKINWKNEPC